MFWVLVAKDLKRVARNPLPLLINLAIPLAITALIGLAFGRSDQPGGLGRIKIAVVDEDKSVFSQFLGGAFDQKDAQKYLQVEWLQREAAMQQINANAISAVVIIPENFSSNYLRAEVVPPLELIKNPAQSFFPAIVEELLGVAVEGLSGLHRSFRPELKGWIEVFESEGTPNMITLSKILLDVGNKFERAEDYLFPPLVTYGEVTKEKKKKEGPVFNLFAYLLPGLASMFLLFIVDNCVRDLYREIRMKTLGRYRTLHVQIFPFILSKVCYAMVVGGLSAGVMFGAGGIVFGIDWKNPLALALVAISFALFASGFMAFLAALARKEDRADTMNNALILGIAFAGGSLFPAQQLPAFLRDHISPLMPNYWFVESVRNLQTGGDILGWTTGLLLLTIGGLIFSVAASALLSQLLKKGGQP